MNYLSERHTRLLATDMATPRPSRVLLGQPERGLGTALREQSASLLDDYVAEAARDRLGMVEAA